MKNRTLMILFACSILTSACKSKDNSELKQSDMEKVLIKQIENGNLLENHCCIIHFNNYTKDDWFAACKISDKILKDNGYIVPVDFKEKIKLYFGRDISDNIMCFDSFDKCNKELLFFDEDGFERGRFFYLSKEYPFISQSLTIPELIDYQSKYPNIKQLEDTIKTEYTQPGGEILYRTRWKDVSDLSKQRDFNIQLLIHRNKYLFNESKASLAWLLNNDQGFIYNLMIKFGYDKDNRINEFVLKYINQLVKTKKDNIKYNYSDCGGLLYTRDCNSNLKINRGVLTTLTDITNMENKEYLEMLIKYLIKIEGNSLQTNLSEEEKIQLYCTFGRTELDILKKYPYIESGMYAEISSLLAGYQDKYKEIAKQNNYWDIANFDDIVKVVEWEYPIANDGEDKEPFDYTTLK